MKITKKKIQKLVRESLRKKLLEQEAEKSAAPEGGSGKQDKSTIGQKASKSGVNTLETHLEKLKTHASYEQLKKEADKGPEQKLQLLDMFMGDMLGVGDEVLKPIAQQIINAFRKGAK